MEENAALKEENKRLLDIIDDAISNLNQKGRLGPKLDTMTILTIRDKGGIIKNDELRHRNKREKVNHDELRHRDFDLPREV